jgi:nucleoside-diphosphate-sugar epimerase
VAVLGGTGFAGHNVRNELEEAGITVGVFSRTTGCDLLDRPSAWAKLDAFRPTHLVNCAAVVGSVNYVTDFAADVVDVNMRIVLNIYKLAQQMHDVVVVNPIANCVVHPGVVIGEGAAVGSCTLVTRDLEPWRVYVGVPARPIGDRPRERIIQMEARLRRELGTGSGKTRG